MPTQAVKKRQTAPLKKSKGTPIPIPGVNPLMSLEAVDGVDPEGLGAAALFVEAGVEPDIHQSTSAKKAVMNNRYSCNKITTTQIQISRQSWNGFFSNGSYQIKI